MKTINLLKSIALAAVMLTSCQSNNKEQEENSSEIAKEHNDMVLADKDDEKDADFVVNAIAANLSEINMAKLALTKSTNSEVKEIAGTLEADHTKVLSSLKGYAATNGLSTPTTETPEATEDRNNLAEKTGEDFDKKWCEKMQDNHNKSIRAFESRMNKTEDVALKDLIARTLPDLKNHLVMLKNHEDASK
jgi:putative membrane protein